MANGIGFSGSGKITASSNLVGSGGIYFSGTAEVVYKQKLEVEIEGRGGLRFGGQALVSHYQSGGIVENNLWELDPSGVKSFQNFRPVRQVNRFMARDEGPEEIGNITNGILGTQWILEYVPTTGEFILGGETLFSVPGVQKIDLTFDVWGHPCIAYITEDRRLFIRFWDEDEQSYIVAMLDTDSADVFCCNAERRLPWSYRNNKIYVVYVKDNELLVRSFQEQLFSVARRTAYDQIKDVSVSVLGFGLDEDYKLQIVSKHVLEK